MKSDEYIVCKVDENYSLDKLSKESKTRLTFNLLHINMDLLKDAVLRTKNENDSKILRKAVDAMMSANGVIVRELIEIQEEELRKYRFNELSDEEVISILEKRKERKG